MHLPIILLMIQVVAAARPIVLFHGLGDSCCNDRVDRFTHALSTLLLPTNHTRLYSVMVGATPRQDQRRSFFDNANRQVEQVCKKLLSKQTADGFDAIGFSQGGLLMRAVVVRCEGLRVRRLITLGSPHVGVSAAPGCPADGDGDGNKWCRVVKRLIETSAYSPLFRNRVIPAQYYRNPKELKQYFKYNRFLADINQELRVNGEYKKRFVRLDRFVMYKFTNDTVLEPSETAWFGQGDPSLAVVRNRTGLDDMIREGKVEFKLAHGRHMQITAETMKSIAKDLSDP